LVIGTHGVTSKLFDAKNSRVLRNLTVKSPFRIASNLLLSGKLVSRLWLRSRSVLVVPKKDNTPRHLGIGDAWYRLVGRASLRVGGALYPHQLGVAIKNGCEIGGRTAQMAFDAGENLGLLALDNDNAFNTMPHGEICTGLVEYFSHSSTMPIVIHPRFSSKGNGSPTWPPVVSRETTSAPSSTP
jgi:hypothetical protein